MRGKNEFIFLKMEIRVWWFMAVRMNVRVSPGEPWKPQVFFSWVTRSPGNLSPWFSGPHGCGLWPLPLPSGCLGAALSREGNCEAGGEPFTVGEAGRT